MIVIHHCAKEQLARLNGAQIRTPYCKARYHAPLLTRGVAHREVFCHPPASCDTGESYYAPARALR